MAPDGGWEVESEGDDPVKAKVSLAVPVNPLEALAWKAGSVALLAVGASAIPVVGAIGAPALIAVMGTGIALEAVGKVIQKARVDEVRERTPLIGLLKNHELKRAHVKAKGVHDDPKLAKLHELMFDPKKDKEKYYEKSNRAADWAIRAAQKFCNFGGTLASYPLQILGPAKVKLSITNEAANMEEIDTMIQRQRMKNTDLLEDIGLKHASTASLKEMSQRVTAEAKAYEEVEKFKEANKDKYDKMSDKQVAELFTDKYKDVIEKDKTAQAAEKKKSPNVFMRFLKSLKESHTKSYATNPTLLEDAFENDDKKRQSTKVQLVRVVSVDPGVAVKTHNVDKSETPEKLQEVVPTPSSDNHSLKGGVFPEPSASQQPEQAAVSEKHTSLQPNLPTLSHLSLHAQEHVKGALTKLIPPPSARAGDTGRHESGSLVLTAAEKNKILADRKAAQRKTIIEKGLSKENPF